MTTNPVHSISMQGGYSSYPVNSTSQVTRGAENQGWLTLQGRELTSGRISNVGSPSNTLDEETKTNFANATNNNLCAWRTPPENCGEKIWTLG